MKEVSVKVNESQRLTSMEVAEMVSKDHHKLLRDIRTYLGQLGESEIGHSEFFQESTYQSEQNKTLPCYMVTKKGCEFIAHKLTGVKGTVFTAKYINRFHDMEAKLAGEVGSTAELEAKILQFMSKQNDFNKKVLERIESEAGKGKQIKVNPHLSYELDTTERVKKLRKMVNRIAELLEIDTTRILHLMYLEIEKRTGISLNAYKLVYQSETGDINAGNLQVISQHDWIYEVAVDMCKDAIKKYEVFPE